MAKFEYERIEQLLWNEFTAAVKEKNLAVESFNSIRDEIPSGLPHPNSTQRIKNASKDYSAARQKVVIAMGRLNGFRNRGIVPEDLKSPRRDPLQLAKVTVLPNSEQISLQFELLEPAH